MNSCLRWANLQLNAHMKFFFFVSYILSIYCCLGGCMCAIAQTWKAVDNLQETLQDVYLLSLVVMHTSGQLAQGLPGDAPGSLPSQLWGAGIADAHHHL